VPPAQARARQVGAIAGRVTDAKTQAPVPYATVLLEGTERWATANDSGVYRMANVPPGAYVAVARSVGYLTARDSVTVVGDGTVTVNFALQKSVQHLDEIVVTGTIVPTEVKALPTPVTIISSSDIAQQHPVDIQQVLRQAVPGAVAWDIPGTPDFTPWSARGASTLGYGSGQMKVYIDGIEVSSSAAAAVDPTSVDRVEVIRGPQAAAIYGSDAIGGVVEIFTKRGGAASGRPQVNLEAAVGDLETPYPGVRSVTRQAYSASVSGGGTDAGYNIGGSYAHTNPFLPNGELSALSNPSVYGGVRFARGIATVDISGRYLVYDEAQDANPDLLTTGVSSYAKPFYTLVSSTYQSVGTRVTLDPTSWWDNNITLGFDRKESDTRQTRPRLTTPADTLLALSYSDNSRTSVGFNSAFHGALASHLTGSLIIGADLWLLPINQYSASATANTSGSIVTDPSQPIQATRTNTRNTGEFVQGQLGLYDALFLTVGLRTEQNSDFGDSLKSPVSSRVGLSYARSLANVAFKVRTSYGSAIKPPSPGDKLGFTQPGFIQLANSMLGPERQTGWDAGFDVDAGARGSLGVTYFDQTAKNLIQQVFLPDSTSTLTQFENIGRVRNTGVEIEGAVSVGVLQLKANYAYVRARIVELPPGYEGELSVGDQAEDTPRHTAGASFTLSPLPGTSLGGGVTFVGRFDALDVLAYFRCVGGTGSCRNTDYSFTNYLSTYPGFAKVNATISQRVTPWVSAFISVDNLTDNHAYEFLNNEPVTGRLTMVGVRCRY
jgi:outer membrane receptor protein involved in Fe transport